MQIPVQIDPNASMSGAVPDGEYLVMIPSSMIRQGTKDVTTQLAVLDMQIIDQASPYCGQVVTRYLCIQHADPSVQARAHGELNKLAQVLGVPIPVGDTDQLHNKPFVIRVRLTVDSEGRENNEVKAYMTAPTAGVAPAAPAGAPPQPQTGQPPAQPGYAPPAAPHQAAPAHGAAPVDPNVPQQPGYPAQPGTVPPQAPPGAPQVPHAPPAAGAVPDWGKQHS